MKAINDLWDGAQLRLKEMLNADVFERWISIIHPTTIDKNTLFLSVDNDYYQTWLEENYLTLIIDALRDAGASEHLDVKFFVQSSSEERAPLPEIVEKARRTRRPAKPMILNSTLNPSFTFEDFVIGPSNSFAHAAALAVAQTPGRAYNPLFIYGKTGLGKTHLIQAVGHRVQQMPKTQVAYVTSETLLNEYVESIKTNTTVTFRNKYRSVDLLLIDDIHFLAGKNSLQEEFFHTFNALHQSGKQIIMTSDRPANEIVGLEQRLVSRFEWGLVTELEQPDFETRLAILKYKQNNAKVALSDTILTFIAENVKSNVRTLEGALMRAVSITSLNKMQPLTIDLLRSLLKDQLDKERQEDLTFDEIQRVVAEHFDLRMTDMSSKRRPRSVAFPRQVAMFLCRKLTRSSLPDIANAFGKTHATVVHACKTIQGRIDTEPAMRDSIRSITRKMGRDPVSFNI